MTAVTESAKTQQLLLLKLNRQLASFSRSNQYKHALHLFDEIHSLHRLKPDPYTLSSTLTACAHLRDTAFGSQLHAHATKSGLNTHLHVANTLLSLYSKAGRGDIASVKRAFGEIRNPDVYSYTTLLSGCNKMGYVAYAWEVFDKMQERERSVTVWNAMITGRVEGGSEEVGFGLFREMRRLGAGCDGYSFSSVLSGCGWDFGRQVHSLVIKEGFLARSSVVNALITMCFNVANVMDAYSVFEQVEDSVRDEVTYNAMIDGLTSVGRGEEALDMFRKMLGASLRPTESTFVSLMSSCSFARVGFQIHAQAMKVGFGACTSVSNAAITMYATFEDLRAAIMVFEGLEDKDVVSWNSMISSYAQGSAGQPTMLAYLGMQRAGFEPDEYTFGSLLASSEFVETVEMVHALVLSNGFIANIHVCNALISAYSKHGNMNKAYQVFSEMFARNLISWNAVMSGFLLNGLWILGLELFSKLLIVLTACTCLEDLYGALQFHAKLIKDGFHHNCHVGSGLIDLYAMSGAPIFHLPFQEKQFHAIGNETRDPFYCISVNNAFVAMHAKCGNLQDARKLFDRMPEHNTVSLNSMVAAYAQHRIGLGSLKLFEQMLEAGTAPTSITFVSVLSACAHT
ncbi:hypothetical protein Tsubulata_007972 [Turnera subulata]|uniref:Pentacotripeptide-repeat region of PRORP domain-containing protein n=1 Tax=Turnera subulata TaxID=218843 RepID=A0A9Q0JIZ4_9ROSI|nr:hypothetical protein Tsubulata_007972 [Turnera subulata]